MDDQRQSDAMQRDAPIRVALVNDYEIILAGIARMLEPFPRIQVVDLAAGREPDSAADVALFDTYSRPGLGLDRVRTLSADPIVGAVAIYSFQPGPESVLAALSAGAQGVLAKALPAAQLNDAIERLADGQQVVELAGGREKTDSDWPGREAGLTFKESELLAMLATGAPNRELARGLYVSENTIKTRLRLLYAKLGVNNRTQAASYVTAQSGFAHRSLDNTLGVVGGR